MKEDEVVVVVVNMIHLVDVWTFKNGQEKFFAEKEKRKEQYTLHRLVTIIP